MSLVKVLRIGMPILESRRGSWVALAYLSAALVLALLVMHGCHAGGHDDLEP